MPRRSFTHIIQFGSATALAGSLSFAQAVELGEAAVRSYRGQPLVADIELVALADPNANVQVRIANPDVYRGANVEMHPALSSLNLSVMRRDGRQYLHITSLKPADSERIHVFFDLVEGGRGVVRGATLGLAPDPQSARLQANLPAPAPAAAAAVADAPGAGSSSQALEAARKRLAMREAAGAPVPRAADAACGPRYSAEQIKTCTALDYKNAMLTAQIVELEEKVALLQSAVSGPRPAPAPPPKAVLPPPQAAVALKGAQPDSPPAGGMLWWLAGGAVVALLGALIFVLWRKMNKGGAAPLPMPTFFTQLKNRLSRKKALPEEELVEEPQRE
ncbi:MAG: hypothetical protein Q8R69_07255 [Telluria sp.]|nr:hypothetical protein [Telluria sp.]